MYLRACFNNSPTSSTTLVVPSPAMSSRAVAGSGSQQNLITCPLLVFLVVRAINAVPALAIMTATPNQRVSDIILVNLSASENGIHAPVGFWIVISRSNF